MKIQEILALCFHGIMALLAHAEDFHVIKEDTCINVFIFTLDNTIFDI